MLAKRAARLLRRRAEESLDRGSPAAAVATGRLAVTAAERSGDLADLDAALCVLAMAYSVLGAADGAAAAADRRIAIAERLGDGPRLAAALAQRGEARIMAGRFLDGAVDNRRALALLGGSEPRPPVGRWSILSNQGEALMRAGLLDEASEALRKAYALASPSEGSPGGDSANAGSAGGDELRAALTASQIGRAHLSLGQPEKAVEWARRAEEHVARLPGRPPDEAAEVPGNLALALSALNRHDEAADAMDRALRMAAGIPVLHRQGLLNAAEVARRAGRHDASLDFAGRVLDDPGTDPGTRAFAFNLRSLVRLHQGRPDDAVRDLAESLRLKRATGDDQAIAVALGNLVRAHLEAGRPGEAAAYADECETLWARFRGRAPDEAGLAGLHERTTIPVSQSLQELRLADGDPDGALEVVERSRSGPLAALLRAARPGRGAVPDDPPGLDRIEHAARRLDACLLYFQPHFDMPSGPSQADPSLALRQLRELHAWAVAPDGRRAHHRVAGDAFRAAVEDGPLVRDSRDMRDLGPLLLHPFADLLRPERAVVVLPSWLLWTAPFAAYTVADGVQLIDRHPVAYAPSAHCLELLGEGDRPGGRPAAPLIIGAPVGARLPVPGGGFEPAPPLDPAAAAPVAGLYDTEPLGGAACTVAVVRERLRTADLVHVFAHASLDARPRLDRPPGAIALCPFGDDDGQLTYDVITATTMRARLVVLTTCHSGLGMITLEGVRGLIRAFYAAGAESVVATLGEVPAAPTARIATWLHEGLRDGASPAVALRSALLKAREEYREPAVWAPFVVHGLP